jgi:hypothetical protein
MTPDPQAIPFPDHTFLERFALARWDREGLLLDVETGVFYRLNDSALYIANCFSAGHSVSQAAGQVAQRYRLDPAQAFEAVAAFLRQLQNPPSQPTSNPIQFSQRAGTYCLQWQGRDILEIDALGHQVRRLEHAPSHGSDAELLWAMPHLLTLKKQTVLHASAVRTGTEVIAFSGGSGVGKTTLARLLQHQGFPLVSEDLVVVAAVESTPHVFLEGEERLRRWAFEQGAIFSEQGFVDTGGISEALGGPALRLRKLVFVRSDRHAQAAFAVETLQPLDALVHLLENSFAELGQPAVWRQILATSEALAASVAFDRVQVPQGLPALEAALASYMRMQA